MKYKLSTKSVIVAPTMSDEDLKRLAPYYQKEPIFDLPEGAVIVNLKTNGGWTDTGLPYTPEQNKAMKEFRGNAIDFNNQFKHPCATYEITYLIPVQETILTFKTQEEAEIARLKLIASYPSDNAENKLTASQAKAELIKTNQPYEKLIDELVMEGHLTPHDIDYFGQTEAIQVAMKRKKEYDEKHGSP